VLVPVHNQGKYLPGFLANLARWPKGSLQVLISENGSTDNSVELIEKSLASLPGDPPEFFRQAQNIGVVKNGQLLWQKTKTYLAFCAHPDDLHGAGFLPACLKPFEEDPETILSMCQPRFMDEQGRPYPRSPKDSVLLDPRKISRAAALQYFMYGTTGLFIYGIFNKEKCQRLNIPVPELSHYPFWEYPLILALFLNGRVAAVPAAEFTYRLHIHAPPDCPHKDYHHQDTGGRGGDPRLLPEHAVRFLVRFWEIVDLYSPRSRWGKRLDKFWLLLGAWRSEGGSVNWFWRVKKTILRDLWTFAQAGEWREFFILLSFLPLKIRVLRLLIRQRVF